MARFGGGSSGKERMSEYRLDLEPWIPVIYRDGTQRNVGLVQVFRDAESIRELTGSPPEVAVLYRLLLAIAYSVRAPQTRSEWVDLWRGRSAFMGQCADFVEAHPEWWDLFDDVRPFGQDRSLTKPTHPAHLLRYDCSRDNALLVLDHHAVHGSHGQSPAAIARGLLCIHAYGGSSGGGYTMGPLAVRSVGILTTEDLAGTLVLNVLIGAKQGPFKMREWASGPTGKGVPKDVRGWLLWGSRRIRVFGGNWDQGVTGVAIRPGDGLDAEAVERDPMVLMRPDSAGGKYVAFQVDESKALWRSASVLLAVKLDGRPLMALDQLGGLKGDGEIEEEFSVSLRVIGLNGSAQGPTTRFWRDDALSFGLDVVTDDGRFTELSQRLEGAEEERGILRKRLWRFCSHYLSNGSEMSPDKSDVQSLLDEISPGLNDFWAAVGPYGERLTVEPVSAVEWERILKDASRSAYDKAVDRLYPDSRWMRARFA